MQTESDTRIQIIRNRFDEFDNKIDKMQTDNATIKDQADANKE